MNAATPTPGTIEAVLTPWSDLAASLLARVNPASGLDALRKAVEEGRMALCEVRADGRTIGVFVSRVDTLLSGKKELVIAHASAALKIPVPFSSVCGPIFDSMARATPGVSSVRIHSEHRGLDAILQENGYTFKESVFSKEIS